LPTFYLEACGVEQRPNEPVTELLGKWKAGDRAALERLVPLVYKQLHDLAHYYLGRERPDHTLQSTALVHEAYLRLVGGAPVNTENRAHFIGVAAKLMRQILVDYARAHRAEKRGAGQKIELTEGMEGVQGRSADILALDDALSDLAHRDEQQSRIVELRYFGGLTIEETADVLGVSPATVKRDWSVARAWLARQMRKGARDAAGAVEQS
jgi:RNA polymerase sigma factor (TIGR02999 family)